MKSLGKRNEPYYRGYDAGKKQLYGSRKLGWPRKHERENRMTGNSCMSNDKKQFYKLNYGLLVAEMN